MKSIAKVLTVLTSIIPFCFVQAYDNCWEGLPFYGEANISYDHFRGVPDGTWNGNNGVVAGVNFGISAFDVVGIQAGGSYGIYDWYGRGPVGPGSSGNVQQQGFLTGGISYETPCCSGFQGGVVVDWMFNKNFSVFALDPNFGQLRLQAGYLFDGTDELGLWGTIDLGTAHKEAFEIPIRYRAISQINLFWRHFFDNCAETMVWVGLPYKESLMFHGKRAGQYIVGGSFRVPLIGSLSIEGRGMYMGPTSNRSSTRFPNDNVNISIGLTYAFGTAAGCCCNAWHTRPYMPIANNSNFLVDSNENN